MGRRTHGVDADESRQQKGLRDFLELMREQLPVLKGTARVIATYVLTHAGEARGLTVAELAATIGLTAVPGSPITS